MTTAISQIVGTLVQHLQTVTELEDKALWVRRKVLEMAVRANSGHVSTAMSQTEILVALYFGGILKYDPSNPKWEERDVFILSKGQGGIGLYPILANAGFFPESDLDNFCGEGSHIGVHAEWNCPGVETISGSLGHGLPIGTGIAKAFKDDGKDNLVFVMLGDGELHEGSNWEALFTAAHQKLGNLVLLVDNNDQATLGHLDDIQSSKDGPGVGSIEEKFNAFGCQTSEIWGGNDVSLVMGALSSVRGKARSGYPQVIIFHTKKGKGLSCMEDKRLWHYRVPSGKDLEQCWDDLKVPAEARPVPGDSQVVHSKGMRDCFFDTLYERFKRDKSLVLITADNGFASIEKWAETLPGQLIQVGIAEQQAVGMAAGMAMQGRKPFVYAIAPFVTTRVHEFVKLDVAAAQLPITLVGIGAGYAYSIMSTTHHTAEDIAIMRALPNLNIFSPSDGTIASAVANIVVNLGQPSYVRLDRGGLDDLYDPYTTYFFKEGWLKPREGNRIGIVSTGLMVHTAIKVAEQINATVYDVFQLKPFYPHFYKQIERDGITHVVTLEEHRLPGGLGGIVAEHLFDHGHQILPRPLLRIGAEDRFVFELGGRSIIHHAMGLDVPSIVKRVKKWTSSVG